MSSFASNSDKFFDDIYAVAKYWEFLILRVQALLLWERIIPSLLFSLIVHLIFWYVVLSKQSFTFMICFAAFIIMCCDLMKRFLRRYFDDPANTPGSFTEFVNTSLHKSHIMSVEEISRLFSKVLYCFAFFINKLAPCRSSQPFFFFIITFSASLLCIVLSRYVSGVTFTYIMLNIWLTVPTLKHHNVLSRIINCVTPIFKCIEAEFDKNPLETKEEREAGEREFCDPIVAAATAADRKLNSHKHKVILTDELPSPKNNGRETDLEDFDDSEMDFIRQFAPSFSSEEANKLFMAALGEYNEALGDERPMTENRNNVDNLTSQSYSHPPVKQRSWLMASEYATDDDETEDIVDEINQVYLKPSKSPEKELEGFVVIPNIDGNV